MERRKSQIPNPKSQGSFKSQIPKGRGGVRFGFLGFGIWVLFGIWSLGFGASVDEVDGYGPPTSLPPNYSVITPSARPRPNWIDQSQSAADAKSSGCLQCHTGVEPMHKQPHVVLGCTDCHSGNPARGLKKEQAH